MIDIIQKKLSSYEASNPIEEEHATKEIMQEIALYALWRAKFFDVAVFQGGTSLRILHGLPRFSEDLDFMLLAPDPDFKWPQYLTSLTATFEEFGLKSETSSKDHMDKRIREALIKDNSIANQLDLSFYKGDPRQKIKIKLEIDVTPPAHSQDAYTFLDFPLDFEVRHQDLASNFALKIHALLCREYLKGRDWFDFSWYVAQGVAPNLPHLEAALRQFGPWSDQNDLIVNPAWLQKALSEKIASVDWDEAKEDVRRFLRPAEAKSLDLWSERFFASKLAKLISRYEDSHAE
jgi:predicted nucleotidyltransferase component of viral defense system